MIGSQASHLAPCRGCRPSMWRVLLQARTPSGSAPVIWRCSHQQARRQAAACIFWADEIFSWRSESTATRVRRARSGFTLGRSSGFRCRAVKRPPTGGAVGRPRTRRRFCAGPARARGGRARYLFGGRAAGNGPSPSPRHRHRSADPTARCTPLASRARGPMRRGRHRRIGDLLPRRSTVRVPAFLVHTLPSCRNHCARQYGSSVPGLMGIRYPR